MSNTTADLRALLPRHYNEARPLQALLTQRPDIGEASRHAVRLWIESEGHRRLSLRSILDLPKKTYRARVVPIEIPSFALEKANVFFVGGDRVLVDHATRGRFWFPVHDCGLTKGDAVEIGDSFDTAKHARRSIEWPAREDSHEAGGSQPRDRPFLEP